MATSAVARETVFALRRQIAKIEGTMLDRLETPGEDAAGSVLLRHRGKVASGLLRTGVGPLDDALGGGLPRAALTEIHGCNTRDAGAVAGFALALVSLLLKGAAARAPVLWIGTSEIFREAGLPYARGLHERFGIGPDDLLLAQASKLADALWIAEEAARMTALSAVVLELRGNPRRLDLTATRRLHRRAGEAERPVFLLRQAAIAEPTAAPSRLVVSPASAAPRETVAGPLAGSMGRPAFTITIGKSRAALPGQFTLEWNPDERTFEERRTAHPVLMVSASRRGTDPAAASGAVLAFPAIGSPAFGDQPSRQERATHRRPRRAG